MATLLEGIKANSFVVIGRAGMDFFADPPGTAVENAEVFHAGLGGSSANIAAGICKLGGQAALVTRVSDDSMSRPLAESFATPWPSMRAGLRGINRSFTAIAPLIFRWLCQTSKRSTTRVLVP